MVNRYEAKNYGLGRRFPDDPLFAATRNNDIAEIARLIATGEGDVNCVTWAYREGLQCYVKSHDAFDLIVEGGLVIDEKTLKDFLRFVETTETDFKCEILQRLIDLGAPINGHIEVKADAFLKSWPIISILSLGRPRYLEILLRNGANPVKLFLPDELTPLHFAVQHWHDKCLNTFEVVQAHAIFRQQCELLIEYGADVNARARDGKTPILKAAEYVCAPAIELLLAYGACLLDVDRKGDGIVSLARKSVARRNCRFTEAKLRDVTATFDRCLATYYEVDRETGEYLRRAPVGDTGEPRSSPSSG